MFDIVCQGRISLKKWRALLGKFLVIPMEDIENTERLEIRQMMN